MTGVIRAQDAEVFNGRGDAEPRRDAIHPRSVDRTPGRVRMEAAPFIKEDTLSAFEKDAARLR